MNNSKTLIWAAVVLLLIGTTGCIPGITWLPDSSGFVYITGNDGQDLVHFDLAKKTHRTIVSDRKLRTAWPAVSPDGKSVAVARLSRDKDKGDTLQLLIYDLGGKSKKQSKVFPLPQTGKPGNANEQIRTELYWGPPENKIVVSISTSPPNVGIYDVKTDQLKILKDASATAFAGRPARPDGKGFVVAKWRGNSCAGLSLIGWDGKERPIAVKPQIGDDNNRKEMLTWPFLFTSSWQGAKAVLSYSDAGFEIDTDKLVGKFDSFSSGEPNGENSIRQQFTFPGSQNVLRVLGWTKNVNGSDDHLSRLEILDPHQKRTRTLMENEKLKVLFPSPDGKLVAIRCVGDDKKPGDPQDMIWVIDQTGQVLAKVKVQD
jgi:hypothetical protein